MLAGLHSANSAPATIFERLSWNSFAYYIVSQGDDFVFVLLVGHPTHIGLCSNSAVAFGNSQNNWKRENASIAQRHVLHDAAATKTSKL